MLYLLLKFIHILLAITAVGANMTYGVWVARARKYPEFAPGALAGIKFIDDRIANPAYILMLPTGAAMVQLGGIGFGTRWVAWAMGLWLLLAVTAYGLYTPLLKRQVEVVAARGIDDPEMKQLDARSRWVVVVLGIITTAIIVLMVFKPV